MCPARRTCRIPCFEPQRAGLVTSDRRNRRSLCCGWRALRHRLPIARRRSPSLSRRFGGRGSRKMPPRGGALGERLSRDTGGDVIYDWGGGLIWAALPPKPDAQAALVRARVNAVGGHATLLRASDEVRRNVDVFHPQPSGLAGLSERVRHSFDPKSILNRGRLTRGSAA